VECGVAFKSGQAVDDRTERGGDLVHVLLYRDNSLTARAATDVVTALDDAHAAALSVLASRPDRAAALNQSLVSTLAPKVEVELANLQSLHSADTAAERQPIRDIAAGWERFKRLWTATAAAGTASSGLSAGQVDDVFRPVLGTARPLIAVESAHARASYHDALGRYATSRRAMLIVLGLALLAGVGVVAWLIRSVLPRTLAYSRFATDVAEGKFSRQLSVGGHDEIAQLGRTLQSMARRRQQERAYDSTQLEFSESMQLTETEQEAHRLLQHYLQRSIPGGAVAILNRNNSADRLQAVTDLPGDSPLRATLSGAAPRCWPARCAPNAPAAPPGPRSWSAGRSSARS
jgi:methyl-accepting chemotaxis protein